MSYKLGIGFVVFANKISRFRRPVMMLYVRPHRDVALNGPLLAQVGRDGKTYTGRERSGMLEGCEMIYSGDKRLHSGGHKKPAVKKVEGTEDAEEGAADAEEKPKPQAARKKKVAASQAEGAGDDPAGTAPKPKKAPARRKKADTAQAAGEEAAGAPEQAPKPKAASRRKKAVAPAVEGGDVQPVAKKRQAASRVKKEQAAIEQ